MQLICDSRTRRNTYFILVKLAEIRKEVQCPICLGIIQKTRTVMECLHRFCRDCIDKSMRMGNNECPACRAHCASRRSLRDDPNYDALIALLYPDIDKFEAEIQASIAQTSRRQLEALAKKRTTAKATPSVFMRRSQENNTRNLRGRSRKSSDNEDDDGVNKDSSSDDEHEVRPRRQRRGVSSADDVNREMTGVSVEIPAWGGGGIRSHTRHGSLINSSRNTRVSRLMDHIRKLPQNNHKVTFLFLSFFLFPFPYQMAFVFQLDIHLKLISLDEENIPNPQHVYLCCSPTMPIIHVSQYVALEKGLQDDEIELLLVKGDHFEVNPLKVVAGEQPVVVINPLQLLEEQQTLLDIAKTSAQEDFLVSNLSLTNIHVD
ncbi:putative transcription factor C2H2 family [Helianthus annuus]|nr:putative transcription factor C2H2 family [Helianthus annuus]